MSIYTDPEFNSVPELKPVNGAIKVPDVVKRELESSAEERISQRVDAEFVKAEVTEDAVVYDVYASKYTASELKKALNVKDVMRYTDEAEGPYCGCCYYVARVVVR